MRVYIPFDDGSAVSFDGERFTLHRRPMDIDADLSAQMDSKADLAWRDDWEALVRALETAWLRQRDSDKRKRSRQVYSKDPANKEKGAS